MRHIVCILFCFLSLISFGQFAIVNDKDGFVNLRRSPESTNNIIYTIPDKKIIYTWSRKGDWVQIEDLEGKDSIGYVYKSRIQLIEDFDSIPVKKATDNFLVFNNNQFKITMTKVPFTTQNKKIEYKFYKSANDTVKYPFRLNGKKLWGTFSSTPNTQYGKIQIETNGNNINIPYEDYEDLFDPNLSSTMANYDKVTSTLYISAYNSDGVGAYAVLLIFRNNKYQNRFVLIPF